MAWSAARMRVATDPGRPWLHGATPMLADRVRSPKGVAKGRSKPGEDSLGDLHSLAVVGEVLADDEELVAAEAAHGVRGPDALRQALCDGGEDEVAGLVAELVVHQLEVVDVDEQHGHQALAAPHAGEGVGRAGR